MLAKPIGLQKQARAMTITIASPLRTKRDKIRTLLARGLNAREVANRLNCKINYVHVTSWNDRHPRYFARYMARKRRTDPDYCDRERAQQRNYRHSKYRDQ